MHNSPGPPDVASFHAVADAAFDGLLLVRDGRVLAANPAAAVLFGAPDAEALHGCSADALVAPSDASSSGESTCRRLDGTPFAAEVRRRPYPLPGDPAFVLALRPVSATGEAASEAASGAESMRRFRAIFDSAYEFIGLLDVRGAVVEVNQTTLQVFEFDRTEVVGRLLWEIFRPMLTPEGAARMEAAVREAAAGALVRYEADGTLRGGRIWVDLSLKPIRDVEGRVRQLVVEGRDVTERKRAEAAIRARDERHRTLMASAVDAIVTVDRRGVIEDWNHGAEVIFGYSVEEAVGMSLDVLMPREYLEAHHAGMERVNRTGETRVIGHTVEVQGRRKSGEVFPLELSLSQWRIDDEIHYTGILRDVTERRRAEAVLERTNRHLEQRNRELQEFAYVASHDLQEPLRKITLFASLLEQDHAPAFSEEGRGFLARMQDAAQRMSRLITDLLTFSRVATAGSTFEPVPLGEVAAAACSALEVAIGEADGVVEVGPLPVVYADPVQMYQLFQNLIGNALKFRRPGVAPHVEVTARTVDEEAARPRYRIEVRDNGIGFDEKYLDRIFSPFQRLHSREAYAGTGMGLAICRRIAERHGGTLTASSAPGEGATFVVELPG